VITPEEQEEAHLLDVDIVLFEQLVEEFPSAKLEYFDGKIVVHEMPLGLGHEKAVTGIKEQLGFFRYHPLFIFDEIWNAGGDEKLLDEHGNVRVGKVQPDGTLSINIDGIREVRMVFEVNINSQSVSDLDKKMRLMLGGLPGCSIGVACNIFPRLVEGGTFEGVLFVYYKRGQQPNNHVELAVVKDIGTAELSQGHQASINTLRRNVDPVPPQQRWIGGFVDNNFLVQAAAHYSIELDPDLFYRGTRFEGVDDRPVLELDFLTVIRLLNSVGGLTFMG
jgi:hypothetical protein